MADNNRNWNNQYQQSNNDWEENRNRFREEDQDREKNRYHNGGYDNDYQNQSMRGNWNTRRGDSFKDREMENQSGAYSSDYGYHGGEFGQSNWGSHGSRQNTGYDQSQQWRDDEWNRRNENYGQDWRRNTGYGNDYNRRNVGNSYNQNQNYANIGGYNERYRNSGYGEDVGFGSSYPYSNYGNRNDEWRNDYRNANYDRDRMRSESGSYYDEDDAERRKRMEKINGPHKGKGPKDYHRSEDRIREDVCDRLSDDDRVDASDIQVQVQNDEVILSGTVNSREEKRRAEDIVEFISGVHNVENRIRVQKNDNYRFDRYTGTTSDSGGVGRESGTTNEIIRDTNKERNKNK